MGNGMNNGRMGDAAGCAMPLTHQEVAILRSQFATSNWGGARYRPFAFTEHGAIMVASVLNSRRVLDGRRGFCGEAQ